MQNTATKVLNVIKNNFPYGIRDDFIDTTKVLRIYLADCNDDRITQNQIARIIRENGVADGGRFYFVSEGDAAKIRLLSNKILKLNVIAYYTTLYERHYDFFSGAHIFSPATLKKILQEIDATHFYYPEFCSSKKMTRLDCEIEKFFTPQENSLSLEAIQRKLPYVPAEKILQVLSDTKKYLPTTNGRYVSILRMQFDTDEIAEVKRQLLSSTAEKNCVELDDLDLSSNFALNPNVSARDLLNVIHEKFFADKFIKQGKRLFKRGEKFSSRPRGAKSNLKDFLAEQTELPVEKLFAFAKNLGVEQYAALGVAYDMMTRVEKNFFVKDELANFDVSGVDEALNSFVQGKIIPLRAVTSFTGFPPIAGYSWNLFLLESFLLKHSRQFAYGATAVNSLNIGAIYSKSLRLKNYLDVLATVLVQELVPLEKSVVEKFLIEHGYRMRLHDKAAEEIISRAQEIFKR